MSGPTDIPPQQQVGDEEAALNKMLGDIQATLQASFTKGDEQGSANLKAFRRAAQSRLVDSVCKVLIASTPRERESKLIKVSRDYVQRLQTAISGGAALSEETAKKIVYGGLLEAVQEARRNKKELADIKPDIVAVQSEDDKGVESVNDIVESVCTQNLGRAEAVDTTTFDEALKALKDKYDVVSGKTIVNVDADSEEVEKFYRDQVEQLEAIQLEVNNLKLGSFRITDKEDLEKCQKSLEALKTALATSLSSMTSRNRIFSRTIFMCAMPLTFEKKRLIQECVDIASAFTGCFYKSRTDRARAMKELPKLIESLKVKQNELSKNLEHFLETAEEEVEDDLAADIIDRLVVTIREEVESAISALEEIGNQAVQIEKNARDRKMKNLTLSTGLFCIAYIAYKAFSLTQGGQNFYDTHKRVLMESAQKELLQRQLPVENLDFDEAMDLLIESQYRADKALNLYASKDEYSFGRECNSFCQEVQKALSGIVSEQELHQYSDKVQILIERLRKTFHDNVAISPMLTSRILDGVSQTQDAYIKLLDKLEGLSRSIDNKLLGREEQQSSLAVEDASSDLAMPTLPEVDPETLEPLHPQLTISDSMRAVVQQSVESLRGGVAVIRTLTADAVNWMWGSRTREVTNEATGSTSLVNNDLARSRLEDGSSGPFH